MSVTFQANDTITLPPTHPTWPPHPSWPTGPIRDTGPGPFDPTQPLPQASERSIDDATALDGLLSRLRDLLEDMVERPDYQAVMEAYGPVIQRKLESDPEALETLRKLLTRYGIDLDAVDFSSTDERAEPITITVALVAFAAGAVLGWLAE